MGDDYITEMTGPEMKKDIENGIAAKLRSAELLGIEINCVNKFREKAGLVVPAF
jgi:hypothetical protein